MRQMRSASTLLLMRLLLVLAVLAVAATSALAYWPTPAPTPPAKGAKIADPTWGNLIMRVTDSSDGSNLGTAYSYWPTFSKNNGHIAFYNLDSGLSYVQDFDPVNFLLVGSKQAMFASNPPGGGTPEWDDPIWSGLTDNVIYCHEGTKIWNYNVDTQAWTLTKDLSGRFLSGTAHFRQMSKSVNDDVFGFSLQNSSYSFIGYGAYKVSTDQVLVNVSNTDFDEVQVDKSGRYLVAKLNNGNVVVYDMQLSTNTTLTDGSPDYAPGHSDNGQSTCVGHDNWNNQITFRSLGTPHTFSVVYNWGSNWAHAEHLSYLLDDEAWVAMSTYETSTPPNNDLRCEIFLIRTNGTAEVRHVCHHYSHYSDYYDSPRANVSRDGKYVAFTSNWGNSGRLDLWLVRVPDYGPSPPVANFSGNPTSGTAPLTVAFTDLSTNSPTSWSWTFGDGGTSTAQSPSHQYTSAGNYTVSLTATNAAGSDGETKTNYISVSSGGSPPVANFTGTPTSGTAPLAVSFTDTSTNSPTSWSWTFGDGGTSTVQNPSHTYAAGTYTVSLTATNAYGSDGETKTNYITASSGGGSTPTFVAAGTVASGSGAITPALPAGIASNDILLLFLETANQAISISNQNGGTWAAVAHSPQGTGTAGGTAATRLTVYWSRYNGTQGAPTTSDSGNHQAGRIIAIRGCVTPGDPWDVTAGGVESTADTSGSIPGATTTVANTLVVAAIATSLPDANGTSNFSAWANGNLTGLAERTDDTRSAGNGGGIAVATGEKATAGAYGTTTVTCATSAAKGLLSIALKPGAAPPAAPVANFSGTPVNGQVSLAVSFTDSSTNSPTAWSWSFGDSNTSTLQNPSHTYTTAGDYTVSLTATNAGGSDGETKANYVTVSAANEVVVYPDTWSINWYTPGCALQSGALSDLTTDNGQYMVIRCDTSTQRYGIMYTADTAYTPAQVNKITVEYQAKRSLSDTPTSGVVFARKSDGVWEDRGSWVPGTSDTDWSWNTTAVSTYMNASGVIGFELCCCPANSNNYDISSDKMRFRLELVTVQPPVADFSGTPTSGAAPLAVNFTDLSTNNPTSWSWSFGDSGTSTLQNPSHSYTSAGNYTVSLTATNSAGSDGETKSNYISVTAQEVYVYPDAWNWHANGVGTLIAGGLSDVQTSNNGYMQVRCNTSNHNSGLRYEFHTGYTPGQVSKITVEYELHCTRTDQPYYQFLIYNQSGGVGGMGGGLWTTTDQTFTWNTTAVSTYMSSSGYIHVTMCGCSQNSNNYDTYVDVCRVRLTLN